MTDLREAFQDFLDAVRSVPSAWETGVCCCGAPMKDHGPYDNHAPVDDGYYFINEAVKRAQKALKEDSGAWAGAEDLMGWLNTIESKDIPKTDVYAWAMNYRPRGNRHD